MTQEDPRQPSAIAPVFSNDLTQAERILDAEFLSICFGRILGLSIRMGQPVLHPWPKSIRRVKLGTEGKSPKPRAGGDSQLPSELSEFFHYIRGIRTGELRCVEIRHGTPFSFEVDHQPTQPSLNPSQ